MGPSCLALALSLVACASSANGPQPAPEEPDEQTGGATAGRGGGGRGGAGGGGGAGGDTSGTKADAGADRASVPDAAPDTAEKDATTGLDTAPGEADAAPGTDATARTGALVVYVGAGFFTPGPSAIHVFKLDPTTGALDPQGQIPSDQYPSFFVADPTGRFLYANIENAATAAAAYAIHPASGMLSKLNQVRSGANGAAYITMDATGRWVMQANYNSHTVSVLSVMADGKLGEVKDTRMQGANAFPHCIRVDPTNRFVFVPNRTANTVSQYVLAADTGKLTPNTPATVSSPAGAGPRHIDFHPNGRFAYVINERNSTVTAYAYDREKGTLQTIHAVSTLPAGFGGGNSTADMHVHPSGRFLYGANRGHGSLAMFRIDENTGRLTSLGQQSVGGSTPRNFSIDPSGRFVVVGVQDRSAVSVFRIGEDGRLAPTGMSRPVPTPSGVLVLQLPGR